MPRTLALSSILMVLALSAASPGAAPPAQTAPPGPKPSPSQTASAKTPPQPPAPPTLPGPTAPTVDTAVDAWVTARSWLDTMTVPEKADGALANVEAVAVVLRLDGRIVGAGVDYSPTASARLHNAMSQAVAKALTDEVLASLPKDVRKEAGKRLSLEIEIVGGPKPIAGRTITEVSSRVEPGLDGLALRRGDKWAYALPSILQAGNLSGDTLRSCVALLGELGVDSKDLPAQEIPEDMAFYIAPGVRLAQLPTGGSPFQVFRGHEVIPLTAVTPQGRIEFMNAMCRHLRGHLPAIASDADPVAKGTLAKLGIRGDYRAHLDQYRPLAAGPVEQALTAYALARFASWSAASAEDRSDAARVAVAILRGLPEIAEGEQDPFDFPAAIALWVMADQALQASGLATADPAMKPYMDRAMNSLTTRLKTPGVENDHTRAIELAAAATLFGAGRAPISEPELRTMLDDAWKAPSGPQLVNTAGWLLAAERDLGTFRTPGRGEFIRGRVLPMRSALQASQLGVNGAEEPAPDAAGGFALTGSGRPMATAQSARPTLALAIMLSEPMLTHEAEVPEALRSQLMALRFLRQLAVDERSAYAFRDKSRAVGGIRDSLCDCSEPVAATATALLAALESENAFQAAAAANRPGQPSGGQPASRPASDPGSAPAAHPPEVPTNTGPAR